ncbi:hypothetical protein INS49_001536 [Diaporthe citri]|uniref:uncharacterized protein n=1 Tax=Diaporthe citri TaxID=83186 RepID=UPI001C81E4F6|nr:uncharacterized protein INS49_001536 [Diaporthe citri]KAG6367348.1 hypothetical protein INS49_001536 [Diaporthe citri]
MTTTPTGVQKNDGRNKDQKQSEPMLQNSWDGIVTDKPTFPLSEIMALKRCNFSAHFYVYTRLNGRIGVIARDLIEDVLKKCTIMPDVPPDATAEQVKSKIEWRDSKGKGKAKEGKYPRATATQDADATTDSDQAAEFEIPCQTFEQVCNDLSKCIEGMDLSRYTQSEKQQTRLCLETIRAVSDRAKELSKRSLAQNAASPSLSPTPSTIDPKTHCVVPRPSPWSGDPCGRPLPCVAHSGREEDPKKNRIPGAKSLKKFNTDGPDEVAEKTKELQELKLEYKKADSKRADDDNSQGTMSYSKAAKAAAQYYAFISAYAKPSQKASSGDHGALGS